MNKFISKIGNFCINRLAEVIGLSLIIISVLLLVSLLSYSPEDPNFIFPENTIIKNLMGSKGSYISDLFFQSFGLISILIPITYFFTGINILISKTFLIIIEKIKLILIGCVSLILLQTFVHIGVNIKLLPTTGMTLPYLSYGGSSIISTALISGIVLNLTKRKVV